MSSYALENFKDLLEMNDLRSHDALNDCLITANLYQYLQKIEEVERSVESEVADELGQLDLFGDSSDEITDSIRRKLNLPITKALVYYQQNLERKWERFEVLGISVEREYSTGSSLKIRLHNSEKVKIHSDFLKEMQKANFVTIMEEEK